MTVEIGDLVTLHTNDGTTTTDRPALVTAVLDQDNKSKNDPDAPQLNLLTVDPEDVRTDRHGRVPNRYDAVPHESSQNTGPDLPYTPSHMNVYWS